MKIKKMTLKFGKLEKVTTDEGHLVCKAGAKKMKFLLGAILPCRHR